MRQKSAPIFEQIENFLLDSKSTILNPYSPAHLQDLKRSYFKSEKAKKETIRDLEFLSIISNNYCLRYIPDKQNVTPDIAEPLSYFEEIFVKYGDLGIFDFDTIFDQNDPLGQLWQSFTKFLNPHFPQINLPIHLMAHIQPTLFILVHAATIATFAEKIKRITSLHL